MEYCDWVPPSLPPLNPDGPKLFFVEDNDAVIKMVIKGRSPNLKHVPRTHRTNLDWLFERVRDDPAIFGRFVSGTQRSAHRDSDRKTLTKSLHLSVGT